MSQIIPHLNPYVLIIQNPGRSFSNVSNYTPLKHVGDPLVVGSSRVSVMSQIIPHLN